VIGQFQSCEGSGLGRLTPELEHPANCRIIKSSVRPEFKSGSPVGHPSGGAALQLQRIFHATAFTQTSHRFVTVL